jgi:hypothetical protein
MGHIDLDLVVVALVDDTVRHFETRARAHPSILRGDPRLSSTPVRPWAIRGRLSSTSTASQSAMAGPSQRPVD